MASVLEEMKTPDAAVAEGGLYKTVADGSTERENTIAPCSYKSMRAARMLIARRTTPL